jgi:NitT/TauT family transport system substrate-binding protein
MRSRKDWLQGAAAAGSAAALAAGTARRAAAQATSAPAAGIPLTALVLPTVDATPFYYALKTGWFEKAGLAVTSQPIASGNLAIQAVVAGAGQIALANSLSLAQAHARDIPVEVIGGAGLYNKDQPIARIFVASDSPIRTGKDLEGKVFAVTGLHDLLALAIKAWLASQGADGSKVRYLELAQAQMLPALQQRRVDAIGSFEPFATAVAESGDARAIATPYASIAKEFNVTLWFGYGPWIASHRDAAARFVRVMHDATAYANAHLPEMVPIVASYTGMTLEVAAHAVRNKTAAAALPSQLQPLIDSAAKYGELAAAFPARDLLANPPL